MKNLDILVELDSLAKIYDNPIKCAARDAAIEIKRLRKAARLIHDRHGMVSGSLEMAECDEFCKSVGLEVWIWAL